jgi:lipid-A-disaccharide synthase
MKSKNTVLVVAGEASGDMHAANLISELRVSRPDLLFFGMGGERMRAAGVELTISHKDLSVVGFTEVISKLGTIRRAMSDLYKEAVRRRPGIALLVDYPGFNLRFAKLIRSMVPRIVYYIGPQVWAWGSWRAASVSKLCDALISVIPFECSMYKGSGLECHFVGHPVLDLVKPSLTGEEFRSKFGIPNGQLVGIVPGSRKEEVKRILPVMLRSADLIMHEMKETSFAISVAETIDADSVRSMCKNSLDNAKVVEGCTHDLMQASDLLMVASGTATLEAAVLGRPMSIVYRTSPLTWLLAKGLVKVRSVGLVNIIAGKRVVPELIQHNATPEKISGEILSLVRDKARLALMERDLAAVRRRLGEPGASSRAARIVSEVSQAL